MGKTDHTHHKPLELAVFVIPANERVRMGLRVIKPTLGPMQRICGGYITAISPQLCPTLRCGCPTVLVVGEEASAFGHEHLANPRATQLMTPGEYMLKDDLIYGDVFLVGQGPIETEGLPEPDFISLDQGFNRWGGPGHDVPKSPKVSRLAGKSQKR